MESQKNVDARLRGIVDRMAMRNVVGATSTRRSIREQIRGLFQQQEPAEAGSRVKSISPYQLAILAGLQGKQVYRGTVSAQTKAKRRSKTRRQKASRKANRP